MPRTSSTTNSSNLSRQDIELLVGLKQGLDTLVQTVQEFREEYKAQTASIREEQKEQFTVVMKRVADLETWKATEVQPTRIMKWDNATKQVDDYLDKKHLDRRERVFAAVEPHINKDGEIENLRWLAKTRDRWGFFLTIVGTFLGLMSGLFYWLLDNVIIPMFTRKGGM